MGFVVVLLVVFDDLIVVGGAKDCLRFETTRCSVMHIPTAPMETVSWFVFTSTALNCCPQSLAISAGITQSTKAVGQNSHKERAVLVIGFVLWSR